LKKTFNRHNRHPELDMMLSQEKSSLRGRVARSIFWITWSRGVLQLLNFATTLVVARILMPADYGLMALAGFWTGMAGILADMGLGSAIIQFRNLNKREIDTCFWVTMTLATVCCVALSLRACPEITESAFERVKYGFTTSWSYHML
jgi:hypothetical protein